MRARSTWLAGSVRDRAIPSSRDRSHYRFKDTQSEHEGWR